MSKLKRCFLFICGLFFIALGISCAVISKLGTATISSTPYILSLRYHVSLGGITFIINMIFLLGEILILRRQFQYLQLLQIPTTMIFGCFIDFTMYLLSFGRPEIYISQFFVMLAGICSLALGIALEIIGNIVILPGEGIVKVISTYWHYEFGYTKTCFDVTLVLTAGFLSWFYFGEVYGIREGTLISALITGSIARFFIKHLSNVDLHGNLIFRLPFLNYHDNAESSKTTSKIDKFD